MIISIDLYSLNHVIFFQIQVKLSKFVQIVYTNVIIFFSFFMIFFYFIYLRLYLRIYTRPKPKAVQHCTLDYNQMQALFSRLNQEEQS